MIRIIETARVLRDGAQHNLKQEWANTAKFRFIARRLAGISDKTLDRAEKVEGLVRRVFDRKV